ncbi:MAG TPA: hypothetical protein VJU84_12135 [Pyrinomonadaceae bacterium]|nr:hypothetical protein [Pyrinomonadaceae bacterium]
MAADLDTRYRTMLILWFALLMSVVMFFVMTIVATPAPFNEDRDAPTSVVLFVLAAVGTFLVVLSFAVKRKMLQRSVEKQEVMLVQQALVTACAMCEVSALFGVAERFMIGSGDHYLLFLVSAAGIALHFPKRNHLLEASWKEETRRQL